MHFGQSSHNGKQSVVGTPNRLLSRFLVSMPICPKKSDFLQNANYLEKASQGQLYYFITSGYLAFYWLQGKISIKL
jgi:hypothetical protein